MNRILYLFTEKKGRNCKISSKTRNKSIFINLSSSQFINISDSFEPNAATIIGFQIINEQQALKRISKHYGEGRVLESKIDRFDIERSGYL